MANLSLKHMYKVYDGKVKAVNDFTMDIDDKEFIVFVGPSGCGKSTTLRMIAGLEEITAGELRIGDDVVNDMEPKDRNIAMVFQNYALYPHMSVYDNMAFSLKIARMPKDQIHEKVLEAARILGITEYLDRKPKALSGGQRQRVALGRAIVRNPKVFLLDEPLSNLDAKLRAQMRTEITRLHEKLQTTFIYVTHDQVEAMTMGTRIVVMDAGYVKQIDTPQNLYRYPANKFVAGFIGTPQMNFFDGVIEKRGAEVFFRPDCGAEIKTDYSRADKILVKYMDGKHRVIFGIRPDDIRVYDPSMSPDDWEIKEVVVGVVENLGGETLVYANFDVGDIDNEKGSDSDLVLKTNSEFTGRRGDIIKVGIHKDSVHVFDKDTEVSIKTRIPSENVLDCVVRDGVLSFAGTEVRLPEAVSRAGSEGGELIIPTDALSLGAGDVKLKITGAEEIGGITLYEAALGDVTVFIREEGSPRFSPGEETEAAVDFKKISIGDEVRPLETENRTDGSFLKRKERNERGKKAYNFYLEIGGQSVPAEDALSARLFSYKKTKIFETPLEFVFRDGTASLTDAPSDLSGVITDVHDYGSERFVTVEIGSESICVRSDSGEPGAAVNVKIDQSRLGVKDKNLDIQMI